MTARDFCYWLQGYFEISSDTGITLTAEQVKAIRNHLNLVFYHDIDPSQHKQPGDKEKMQEIHDGKSPPFVNHKGEFIMRC